MLHLAIQIVTLCSLKRSEHEEGQVEASAMALESTPRADLLFTYWRALARLCFFAGCTAGRHIRLARGGGDERDRTPTHLPAGTGLGGELVQKRAQSMASGGQECGVLLLQAEGRRVAALRTLEQER